MYIFRLMNLQYTVRFKMMVAMPSELEMVMVQIPPSALLTLTMLMVDGEAETAPPTHETFTSMGYGYPATVVLSTMDAPSRNWTASILDDTSPSSTGLPVQKERMRINN